jgi:CheY-like chemotaxis protein
MHDSTDSNPTCASALPKISHILVVDDNCILRELHSDMLTSGSYFVTVAHHGVEALSLLAAGPYDLILTDRNMPLVDGVEMIRQLRAAGNRIPVVMVSGSLHDTPLPDDVACEVAAALPKPALPSQVLAAVAFALRDSPGTLPPSVNEHPLDLETPAHGTGDTPQRFEENSVCRAESSWPWLVSLALCLTVVLLLCGCQTASKFSVQLAKRVEINKTSQTLRPMKPVNCFSSPRSAPAVRADKPQTEHFKQG